MADVGCQKPAAHGGGFVADIGSAGRGPFRSQAEVFLSVDLHDHGFDVNHRSRDVEFLDDFLHHRVIVAAGCDHEAVGGLVGRDVHLSREQRCAGCTGCSLFLDRGALLARQVLQHLGDFFRVGIFEVVDPNFFLSPRCFAIEKVDQLPDPGHLHFTGQHDHRIGAFVGDKFGVVTASGCSLLGRTPGLKKGRQGFDHFGTVGMLKGDDRYFPADTGHIDFFQNFNQPLDIRQHVGNDQRVGRS